MLYQQIISEIQRLDHQINSLKQQLQSLPPGNLVCCQHNSSYKCYQSLNSQKTYIPKSNKILAEKLAYKKYLLLLLDELENEKKALEKYLCHRKPSQQLQTLLTTPSPYQQLLQSQLYSISEDLTDWSTAPYPQNPAHPEGLIFQANGGLMVRSKSEMLISIYLYTHSIPFRYECALTLGTSTIYPDFTIRHPQTGAIFYWEHFGMMDSPHYIDTTCSKLQTYAHHGIVPGIQLITTYETQSSPLSLNVIEMLVSHYFS